LVKSSNIQKICFYFCHVLQTMENLNLMNINTNETTKTEAQTTLVMCEELRKLNKIDSIIPQPLLNMYVDKSLKYCLVY